MLTNFAETDYPHQYRGLKKVLTECVGESLVNPSIFYPDMKNKYSIQVIDLRFQVDHLTTKKIQFFEKFRLHSDIAGARSFVILFRHRQIEVISDGNKIIESKVT